MNALNTVFIFALAFVAVFVEASLGTLRTFLGVQIDLLPGIIVYASLTSGIITVTSLAIVAGIWFDSLSANLLGVTMLPLFLIGFVVQQLQHLILREQAYAQLVLGFAASGFAPAMAVLILLSCGAQPLLSVGSLWQWFVMTVVGGLMVPLYFRFFEKIYRTLGYERVVETTFRHDREIARGRQ